MTKARDLANASTALSAVSATELAFVDGVTSAIQTQMDAKAPSSTAVTLTGTQTLTNKTLTSPVIASVINNTLTSTTGDIIYASAANTPARLGIGSSAQVLTVASGVPSWATPAAGGGWTLIASGSVGTGATFTISGIPQTYKNIRIQLLNWSASGNGDLVWKINNTTSDTFYQIQPSDNAANVNTTGTSGSGIRLSSGTVDGSKTDNMGVLDILDYTNTSAFKALDARALTWQNGSPSFKQSWMGGGAYASNSAVTSLVFDPESSSTFDAGTYYLWGEN